MATVDQFKPGDLARLVKMQPAGDENWHPKEERHMKVGEEFEVLRIANGKLWYEVKYHVFTQNNVFPENCEPVKAHRRVLTEELEALAYSTIGVCYIKSR